MGHSPFTAHHSPNSRFPKGAALVASAPDMDDSAKAFLFDLLNTPSPTGFELPGQRKCAAYARQFADRVENDSYGTAGDARRQRGEAARIMPEAHVTRLASSSNSSPRKATCASTDRRLRHRHGARSAREPAGRTGAGAGIIGNTAIHLGATISPTKRRRRFTNLRRCRRIECRRSEARLGLRVGHPAVYADAAEAFGKTAIVGRAPR